MDKSLRGWDIKAISSDIKGGGEFSDWLSLFSGRGGCVDGPGGRERGEGEEEERKGGGYVAFLFASHSKHCSSSKQEYSINATCKNDILTKRQYFIKRCAREEICIALTPWHRNPSVPQTQMFLKFLSIRFYSPVGGETQCSAYICTASAANGWLEGGGCGGGGGPSSCCTFVCLWSSRQNPPAPQHLLQAPAVSGSI